MKRSGPILAALLLLVSAAAHPDPQAPAALPPGVDPVQAGQELAAKLRSLAPAENSRFTGTLKIRKGENQTVVVPLTSIVTAGGTNWQVIYDSGGTPGAPPERLTIVHAPGQSNVYLSASGTDLSRPQRLRPEQLVLPFAGSDFWMMDLGLEFFHWPQQRLVKIEMRRGRSSRVLESANPHPAPGGYSRVLSWIDVETDGLLRAEAYDLKNQLLKEFNVGSFRKVEGQWELQDMEIRNAQTKSRTKLEFNLQPGNAK